MIKPKCDKCDNELMEFGAILLSPPNKNNMVIKMHLCKNCYEEVKNLIISDVSKPLKCDCKFSGDCRYETVILETKELCRYKE